MAAFNNGEDIPTRVISKIMEDLGLVGKTELVKEDVDNIDKTIEHYFNTPNEFSGEIHDMYGNGGNPLDLDDFKDDCMSYVLDNYSIKDENESENNSNTPMNTNGGGKRVYKKTRKHRNKKKSRKHRNKKKSRKQYKKRKN
jgi:hypothetical protein